MGHSKRTTDMNRTYLFVIFTLLTAAACVSNCAAAIVLTNGGFESTGALYSSALGGIYAGYRMDERVEPKYSGV